MAWVVAVEKKEGAGKLQPTQVVAYAKVFHTEGATPVLQLDTFGSEDRQSPGKQSQTLQFGREAAEQLHRLLEEVFNLRQP